MKSTAKIALFLLLILSIFSGTVSALEKTAITIHVFFADNDAVYTKYATTAGTVGEFLAEINISLREGDKINFSPDSDLADYMLIDITRAVPLNLIVDGKTSRVYTTATVIGDFIKEYSNTTGYGYLYDEKLDKQSIKAGYTLNLTSTQTVTVTKSYVIHYETMYITDGNASGEQVVFAGSNGERTIKTEIVYVGGQKTEERIVYDNIDTLPQKRIVAVPVDKAVMAAATETIEYAAVYRMSSTAYTIDPRARGVNVNSKYYGYTASGMKARVGVVAVDPKVIPLGTELYIENYGYAIAGDTGGAIKGMIVDLFFDTLEECIQHGRRNVTVYVLK